MKYILLIPPKVTAFLSRHRYRAYKVILMVLVFITALYTKSYRGEHELLIHNQVGGIFYVMFGTLLFSILLPRARYWLPVVLALGITSLLEVVQWFQIPFMVELTRHKVFAYIFGLSFNPVDFLYYLAGAALSLLVLWAIHATPKLHQSA